MQLKHFPDKPWEQDPKHLEEWDRSGNYDCQQKIDGWRIIVVLTPNGPEFISRHNKSHTKDIEPELKKATQELYKHFPLATQLDSEWLSRRSCSIEYNLPPKLFLLDVMRHGEKWCLAKPYHERHKLIEDVVAKLESRQWIDVPPTAEPGTFVAFYEQQKTIPYSEGVVIKHKDSKIIGNRQECAKNPLWMKIKFRAGSDGKLTMGHLRTRA